MEHDGPAVRPLAAQGGGDYLILSLGYVRGPALSPRVSSAIVFTANWSLYL